MVAISTMPERLRPHAFSPGNNANPRGRPKGRTLTAELRDLLERPCGRGGRTVAQAIAEMLVKKALRGNLGAIRIILDRTEGKVPRRVVLERDRDEDESPELIIRWLEDWRKVAEVRAQTDRAGGQGWPT